MNWDQISVATGRSGAGSGYLPRGFFWLWRWFKLESSLRPGRLTDWRRLKNLKRRRKKKKKTPKKRKKKKGPKRGHYSTGPLPRFGSTGKSSIPPLLLLLFSIPSIFCSSPSLPLSLFLSSLFPSSSHRILLPLPLSLSPTSTTSLFPKLNLRHLSSVHPIVVHSFFPSLSLSLSFPVNLQPTNQPTSSFTASYPC